MSKNKQFADGELVTINLMNLTFSKDGFSMGGTQCDGGMKLFQKIDLTTYPSSNDFTGNTVSVYHGDHAIVSKFVGRPDRINHDPEWFLYDVYEIIIKGCVVQAFCQNLSLNDTNK